ncbi:matrixin family metalloprotease [Tautonia marina]|uniref:matrixin family metalloprotease n=1 Tax=Tautonia marina TaxID=2653855 RepID=UPI0012611867|nr:matrixin family metalloprotease [Tautonia marina]
MFGSKMQHHSRERRPSSAGRKPQLEGLEQRLLLYSTLGGQWAYGSRISYSIPADGTDVAGVPNQMHQAMADRGITEAQWKFALRRAAALWQSATNINMAEVSDTGAPMGISGNQQNDPRFGDLRFFAKPMAPQALGQAFLPPPFHGGTLAGDVVFNSSASWNVNANFDLQTVAIHEIGHSLGLGHSEFSTSVMYDTYTGVKQGLTSDDIAGIRSLYGVRQQDWVDQFQNNQSPWTAVNISGLIDSNRRVTLPNLDITSNQDEDWFYVQAPSNTSGEMIITMQSKDLSSLSPRFMVYNSALQLVAWTVAPSASSTFGATVSLKFTGVPAGTGIYIRAMGWNGGSSGVNGIGAYALRADFSGGPIPSAIVSPPNTTVPEQPDQGGGFINQMIASPDLARVPWTQVFAAPPPLMAQTIGIEGLVHRWDAQSGPEASYGVVEFVQPTRAAMGHFARAALSGAAPLWFTQAIDQVVDLDNDDQLMPGTAARRWQWKMEQVGPYDLS